MPKLLPLCAMLLAAATSISAQTYTVLHHFGSVAGDPSGPVFRGTIAQSRGGAMLTTATDQLTDGVGKAFRISTTGSIHGLHQFSGSSGGEPDSGFILARDGNFYGTTATGGTLNLGTIYKMSADGSVTTLHEFQGGSEGEYPAAAPIQSLKDDLYGTTPGDLNTNYGSVYRITKGGNFTVLHAFTGSDGAYPQGPLVQGTDYNFYGVTWGGGSHGYGTIFRISPSGVFKVLVNFNLTNGQRPDSELIQANDGDFYGVTWGGGGSANAGVLYRFAPNGSFTVLHSFSRGSEGGNPIGLMQASDGNLYGTSFSGGGPTNDGVLFRATLAGDVVPLHDFDATTGVYPYGALHEQTNGIIYGDTFSGGDWGQGVFYSLDAGLSPFVTYLPVYGRAGAVVQILGQGFTDTSQVFFNGTPATFNRVYPSFIKATVPAGATTGPITVTTANGTLTSDKVFIVHP